MMTILTSDGLEGLVLAIETVRYRLQKLAISIDGQRKLNSLFNEEESLKDLLQAWRENDFSIIPSIQILSPSQLNHANGAFAATTNTIYISEQLILGQDTDAIVRLLLEEIGHKVDSFLNTVDTPGDEGAIFAALVLEEELTDEELGQLKAEDDRGFITIDGQVIAVEQDNITGDGGNNNLTGTSGNDSIQGLGGNDTLSGLAGNDTLQGGDGDDSLNGGTGNDRLEGGSGTNTINGDDGDDVLINSFGTVDGGVGTDILINNYTGYGSGVYNTNLSDRFRRTDNNGDLIYYASIENFNITGTANNDSFQGFAGNDRLIGNAGNDNINGGAESDIIIGVNPYSANPGINEIDTLAGGTGSDSFLLGNTTDVFYDDKNTADAGTGNYARIIDFNPSEDIIQLQGAKSNYRLETSPISGISGTAIYRIKPNGEPDELIAVIQGVSGLNLNSSYFVSARDEIAFSTANFTG